MSSVRPYLSIVAATRNDNHGGDLLRRTQIFVNGVIAQARRRNLPVELILVEWNPPEDKPPLAEALDWPDGQGPVDIRIITVAPEIHGRYRYASALPLYQMIAKNAGIRRATGEFVLATNIDILFSHELFDFFAKRGMRRDRMYRVDRYDAMADVPLEATIDEQLAYCAGHLIRVNEREGTYRTTPCGARTMEDLDVAPADSGIRLGPGWFALENGGESVFRCAGPKAVLILKKPQGAGDLWVEMEPRPGLADGAFSLLVLAGSGEPVGCANVESHGWVRVPLSIPCGEEAVIEFRAVPPSPSADSREPAYRVFSCSWKGPAGQSEPRGAIDLRWGRGWYSPETERGESFLWGRDGAEWIVRGSAGSPRHSFRADLEAGPAAGFEPFHLQVRDERGKVVSTAVVGQRRSVPLVLPAGAGEERRYTLHSALRAPPVRVAGDPRDLHFRVFNPLPPRDAVVEPKPFGELAAFTGVTPPQSPAVHTNACGDFTLLSRENWFDLRGYPEFDLFSMHIDALFCLAAHRAGVLEEFLDDPMRIYHIEHAAGSGFTPEGSGKLYRRLADSGIPSLDWQEVFAWDRQMRQYASPMIFNRENWGLAGLPLRETSV